MHKAYWGEVLAGGNIRLLNLSVNVVSGPSAQINIAAGLKMQGAGIDYNSGSLPGKEQWLRWRCSGLLVDQNDQPIFPTSGISGVQVKDFYSQLKNGAFSSYSASNVNLTNFYSPTTVAGGQGLLYDAPVNGVYPVGTGALVQSWPGVDTEIAAVRSQFGYSTWKQTAIDSGYYVRPTSTNTNTSYVNANGSPLYVKPPANSTAQPELTTVAAGNTPLLDLSQISMKPMVPVNGNTALVPDRLLFIDTIEGTENGTKPVTSFGSTAGFFWKGMVYTAGNLEFSGANASPTIRMKKPD